MKINLINPNTCIGMTEKIANSARAVAINTTEIIASSPKHGPESIESAFDEVIASAALLDVIREGEAQQVDAHIIACFGDPALDAAREIATVPVIGIAGAAFQLASLVSYQFGIVTTMTRTLPASEHLLQRYGYQHFCSGARATDIAVLDLEDTSDEIYLELKQECEKSIRIDSAEAIVLGCAGMSDLAERLSEDLQVPVIDGVSAAVKLAESLHQLGLKTSKIGQYGQPLKKAFHGRYQHLDSSSKNR
ncbi:aspartate/glutamate racemase family protein [Psychromonas sp. RZ22]|uniref:aspartate/glutamate racemase family protein n=1 Tax=Psychromonas algarum TaxID=2555643 RepID=UPI001067E65F|nr:aspartate/glutamate racemase family protein [Psychromonas sp. RZ22]TEW54463.1 aspartate/glutamate racemase family protein [Psychromonas sp. RZ22]